MSDQVENAEVVETKKKAKNANKTPKVKAPKKVKEPKEPKAKRIPKERVLEAPGERGRKSAYAGKKIYKTVDDPGLRPSGGAMISWKCIKDGIKFETYRANGGRRKDLADFIRDGKAKVSD